MNDERPAGWFPDPGARHEYRYWDGATWSDQVSDRGVVAVEVLSAPQPVPERASAPAPTPSGAAVAFAAAASPPRRSGRGAIVALSVVAGLLLVVGVIGFVVSSSASSDKDDFRDEQTLLDAQGVEASQATEAIEQATSDVDAALDEFRNATENVVTTGNQVSDAFDTALCGSTELSTLPCFGEITAEEAAGIAPLTDQYSAAVDAQSAAYLKFVSATTTLEQALPGTTAEEGQS